MAILQATSFSGSVDIDTLRLDGESFTKADLQGFKEVDSRITASAGNQIIGTDSDINTSGATIVDNLYMTDGVITSHGTRVLTLANLGYTGATNANYITNNNQLINGSGYQTSTQVNNAIQGVVDAAPAALDTLNELAASLNDDSDFAGTMTTALAGKQATLTAGSNITITDGTISSTDTNTNTQLSDAQVRSKFSAGTNVAISSGGVISSTDTNTNTQLSDAQVRSKFSAGTNVAISNTGVISSTDTNTDTNTQLSTAQVRAKFTAGTNVAIVDGVISSTDTNTDTNTQRTDAEIDARIALNPEGFIDSYTDTNTQLSDAQVRSKFSAGTNVAITAEGVISSTDTNTNTQLSDAQVRAKFSAGANVAISNTGVISSTDTNTDTNTTYTAGNGLSLSGTQFRMAGGSIGAGVNLDTYTSSGYYVQGSNSNTTSGTNWPTNNAGILTVVRVEGNTTHMTQTYDQYNSNAFYNRSYYNGTWSTWRNLAQDNDTQRAISSSPTNGHTGVAISSDWAFDNVKTAVPSDALFTDTNTNTQLSTAQVRGKFSAGTNVAISNTGVISSTDTNTWRVNAVDSDGYVSQGSGMVNKVWKTDATGNPAWRADANTDTTYAIGDGGLTTKDFTAALKTKLDALDSSTYLKSNADDSFSGGLVSTARDEGIFGTYDSTKTDHIWSMGTAYKNHASGTNFGNLYGLGYKHTNNATGGTMAGGHQMVWASNGTPKSAMGDNIWTAGTVTATGGNSTQWNTAYDWGNHASAGYLTSYTDTNTQLSTAQVRAKFTAGTNVAISSGGVISSTDTNTNTTYSAGRGLDISGTTFNLETDLRDSISYIGYDSNDYIQWSNNGWTRTVVNGTERLRVDTAGIDVSGRAKIDTTLTVGSNHVNGSNYSTIAGGTLNLNCHYYGTIAGGYSNGLCGAYSGNGYSFIGAGACNRINQGLWSGIVSGCNNIIETRGSIDSCQGNFIGSGNSNYIMANNRSSIVGGNANSIHDQSDCSIIGGGYANVISHAETSIIGGGQINYISNGCHQTIGGGFANVISSPCNNIGDTISGGCGNHICNNNNSNNNTIAGGTNNRICTYYHGNNFIGGGTSNCIQSSYGAGNTILGGGNNRVYGGAYITIIGGSSINASASNYVYVPNLCNVNGGTSDCRLKESICNIPYGLSHVSQLEPVSYKFTSDESKATKYGFLAQCVQEIMPDLITNHPTALVDGTPVLQFDKDAIWSSMVNAIKDLKNEVDALKARIDILEA